MFRGIWRGNTAIALEFYLKVCREVLDALVGHGDLVLGRAHVVLVPPPLFGGRDKGLGETYARMTTSGNV